MKVARGGPFFISAFVKKSASVIEQRLDLTRARDVKSFRHARDKIPPQGCHKRHEWAIVSCRNNRGDSFIGVN
jgi:hypothetical protein